MRYRLVCGLICLLLAGCGIAAPGEPPAPTGPAADPTATQPVVTPTASAAVTPTAPAPPPATGTATIVYEALEDGSLRAIDPVTGAVIVLADPTAPYQNLPWSAAPDGRTIAVVTGQGWQNKLGPPETVALRTVGSDGSNPRKLIDLRGELLPSHFGSPWPALLNPRFQRLPWTPDGRRIIVVSAHEGQVDLYAVAADGSGVIRLTRTSDLEFEPVIAPDGAAVAYGSASSFGAGAGWGDVAAWVQPLADSEASPLLGAPPAGDNWSSVAIAGWADNRQVVALSRTMRDQGVVWIGAVASEPRPLHQAFRGFAWDMRDGALVFTDRGADSAGFLVWRNGDAAPTQLGLVEPDAQPYLGPGGATILLCIGAMGPPQRIALWRDAAAQPVGEGQCDGLAWSDDGRVAVAGGSAANLPGLVVDLDAATRDTLPVGARPAGWLGDAVYLFAPLPDGAGWQLYRAAANSLTPVSEPLAEEPIAPALVEIDG